MAMPESSSTCRQRCPTFRNSAWCAPTWMETGSVRWCNPAPIR